MAATFCLCYRTSVPHLPDAMLLYEPLPGGYYPICHRSLVVVHVVSSSRVVDAIIKYGEQKEDRRTAIRSAEVRFFKKRPLALSYAAFKLPLRR